MKRKLKLKPYVLPSVYIILVVGLTIGIYYAAKDMKKTKTIPNFLVLF